MADIYSVAEYGLPFASFVRFSPKHDFAEYDIHDEAALFRGALRYKTDRTLHALFLFFVAMHRAYRLEGRNIFTIEKVAELGDLR